MADKVCRIHLRTIMETVTQHTTEAERKEAHVTEKHNVFFEFHGPDGFSRTYHACCRTEAKAMGWESWLGEKGFGPPVIDFDPDVSLLLSGRFPKEPIEV